MRVRWEEGAAFEGVEEELAGFHKLVNGSVRSCLELRKTVPSSEERTGGVDGFA